MKPMCAAFTILTVIGVAGCNESQPTGEKSQASSAARPYSPPTKTVTWFIDHRGDLEAILNGCRDNPGLLAKTPDCTNANEARNRITVQEMKDALK